MDNFETLIIEESEYAFTITMNRPERKNSLNPLVIKELENALNMAEKTRDCKFVVIKGQKGFFCTGLDFESFTCESFSSDLEPLDNLIIHYMNIIQRLTLISKFVISVIDGQVIGGGVGLASASDYVIATPQSQFSLPEALWGLIPSMVTPYLIRRIGFHKAKLMALTTFSFSSEQALNMNLVDEISDMPHSSINRLWLRLRRIDNSVIGRMKQYFRKMWIITEQIEEFAVNEIRQLMKDEKVRNNIENFVKFRRFPWEMPMKS